MSAFVSWYERSGHPVVRSDSEPTASTHRRLLARLCGLSLLWLVPGVRADEVATALYVRTDTDDTTVVSPRVRGELQVGEQTSVDTVYTIDVWSSASIDIRTAASKRVIEQRDEIDASVEHVIEDLTITAGYRYSKENDYVSNGGSTALSLNLAGNAATLAGSVFFGLDLVGRSGDAEFERGLDTFGGRLAFTQVLDTETVLQASYDLTSLSGYQASPYRFVGLGGNGRCTRPDAVPAVEPVAPLCVPERVPEARLRHAPVLLGRRALGDAVSLGLWYRLYFDSWNLLSHTVEASAGFTLAEPTTLTLRYRFYTQGAADFYRRRYELTDLGLEGLTSDRKLSAMGAHRVAAEMTHELAFDGGTLLSTGLTGGLNFYRYDEFPGLERVTAVEVTATCAVKL